MTDVARPRPVRGAAGMKPTIRLKAPHDGETVIEDQVQGRVAWQNKNLDDFVLLRSRRQRRPICSPSSSTTTTWASPTSSAATII